MASRMIQAAKAERAHLDQLLKRANDGDSAATMELRRACEGDSALWSRMGDLRNVAEATWLELIAGNDAIVRDAILHRMTELRGSLTGVAPSPLECLLVDRVVLGWLQVYQADLIAGTSGEMGIVQAEYHQRRLDRAQRRYLSAIRALASVRRLLIPAIQVNIAQQQLNVARGTDRD